MKYVMTTLLVWLSCLCQPAVGAADSAKKAEAESPAAGSGGLKYSLDYEAAFVPEQGIVQVRITVRQPENLLRHVRFAFDADRYRDFAGDGRLTVAAGKVEWSPPRDGGALSYVWVPDHRRGRGGFDSLMEDEWAIFRGDNLLPPVDVTARKGASSRARLRLSGPDGWSFISAYPKDERAPGWFTVRRPDRSFDRPVGWMAAGRLGVRWVRIGDVKVAVAGPTGQGVRHLDMLAFLRWNLPALVAVFPEFPGRVVVVSAGDPMWRGGLSGPASLYIHADRPLISGNGTSTLLHELIHVAQGYRAAQDEDWIVEAIAEFYTLEIMRRSGTISEARYLVGFEKLYRWAEESGPLEAASSAGARTARGVTVMQDLDSELRRRSHGRHSLDDVARELAANHAPVSVTRLREIAAGLVKGPLDSLSPERLGTR